ncbi:MAG TPA: inositol monophosphatase family protein [Bacillales bacterium]|nr:inositol monophosphatase family protein [Bacillales bacterium]
MGDINWNEIDRLAKLWIKQAGEKILLSFSEQVKVDHKEGPDDLVTDMDRRTEQFFIERIHQHFPDHRILGEEGYGDDISSADGTLWIIDPIDGTMNFVHQQCNFAISIGVFHNGVGQIGLIYDVASDELFHCVKGQGAYVNSKPLEKRKPVAIEQSIIGLNATWVTKNRRIDPDILAPLVRKVRGTRSYGSAATELAYIAAGRMDAYFSMRLAPWDFAAGLVLLEEVGAVMTRADGRPVDLLKQNSIFAGEAELHRGILEGYVQKGIDQGMYINDGPLS